MFEFHFLRPFGLLGFLPLAACLYGLWKRKDLHNPWTAVCDPELLKEILRAPQKKDLRGIWMGVFLTASVGLLALAGPSFSHVPEILYRSKTPSVIVFDLSEAMWATDLSPSRLTRAKFKLIDLLGALKDQAVGLVTFAGEPFVASPLTEDPHTLSAMVPELSPNIMPILGSQIAPALERAAQLIQQATGDTRGEIILFTASSAQSSDWEIAEKLSKQGYRISVLAFATDLGAPIPTPTGFMKFHDQILVSKLDRAGLSQIASLGKGQFIPFSNDGQDLRTLLLRSQKTYVKKTKIETLLWHDDGRMFVLFLLPWVLLGFRRGFWERLGV